MGLAPGLRLGPYEILGALGTGGMGEVYRARDPRLGRELAIKVLPEELASDRERLTRFGQEARSASALNHPNIVTIYDIGQAGSAPYIAMELVKGNTVRELLAAGPLTFQKAADLASQAAHGLARAHEAGIVHRDLKPENLMVTSDGFVKILDFGLAKLVTPLSGEASAVQTLTAETSPGTVLGTVGYMSPEQASGRALDFRSDQFSLGSILYEMVTGRRAFWRETPLETLAAIILQDPEPVESVNPSVPEPLVRIIRRCLSRDPQDRYASTRDLAHDLKSLPGQSTAPLAAAPLRTAVTARPGKARRAMIAGLVIAALAAAALLLTRKPSAIDSLAILPFANAGGDASMEFLSDGITESLINNLSRVPGVRVTSRTSAFAYKGRKVDPRSVGKELGVRAVLVGSIVPRGQDLTISAELVDTRDNSRMWGDEYKRAASQILAMQDEISREIASALRLGLKGEEQTRLTRRYTDSPEAYQLYLKARYFWNQFTEDGLKKSIRYSQEAIEKDPTYALAYVGLSASYAVLGANYWPPREAFPKAKAAMDKALEIDPSLPEAQTVIGAHDLLYAWNWAAAERGLRRAMEISPTSAEPHVLYAYYLWTQGRLEQAVSEMQRAAELDPLSPAVGGDLALTHYFARQYDTAIEQLRKNRELAPGYYQTLSVLGSVYVQQKKAEEAIAQFREAIPLAGGSPQSIAYLGYGYGSAGQVEDARGVLRQLEELSRERHVSPFDVALVHIGLGDKDSAFGWLDKAYQDRSTWLITLKVDPMFDILRPDPRFADLVRRIGLP
jgi:TolB-like protein/Flp pilus assembly protein TadD/tRNA A-37 threonylcarbamoyl transferase component Bud32